MKRQIERHTINKIYRNKRKPGTISCLFCRVEISFYVIFISYYDYFQVIFFVLYMASVWPTRYLLYFIFFDERISINFYLKCSGSVLFVVNNTIFLLLFISLPFSLLCVIMTMDINIFQQTGNNSLEKLILNMYNKTILKIRFYMTMDSIVWNPPFCTIKRIHC